MGSANNLGKIRGKEKLSVIKENDPMFTQLRRRIFNRKFVVFLVVEVLATMLVKIITCLI